MLDKNSPEPMYEQIARILRMEIAQNSFTDGTIGTHGDLAKRFNVSMITVRKAIEILVSESLLITKPGKGTYINRLPLQDGFNRLAGMSSVMAMNNLVADVSVGEMNYVVPPTSIPKSARTELGDSCLYIERTHSVGGKVIGLAHIYIPDQYARQFSFEDVSQHTIYYLMANKLNIQLGKGIQNITAIPAGTRIAEKLKVSKNSPVLMLERFSYSAQGQLLEYMLVYYKHDKYSFQVELDLSAD